jgi:glycosyltransferase involved in cell wall biosynthesis
LSENPPSLERQRPRILILVKGLGLGGVERILSESIPYLNRDRFDYELCYFTPWKDDVVPAFEEAGIATFCLDISTDASPRNIRKVRSFLRQRSYNLIHSHSPFPSAVARMVAPRQDLHGIVHTEHSLPGSRNWITRTANRVTYPRCDVVISVSKVVKADVDEGRIFRPGSSRLVYGGIGEAALSDVDEDRVLAVRAELGIPEGDNVVGNIAHLRSQKGHDVWLRTAARVVERSPNTTFVIVGREKQPGHQKELEALATRLGISERVRFVGFRPDPYPYLAAFDVFLMTSEFEGFPIALVEAMAMGRPVVSTDVGGVGEAIGDEETGLLAPAGDEVALARHVIALLEDAPRREAMASRARTRARTEFTVERMVGLVEQTYDELIPR